jgi:hypothetical protein
VTKGFKTLDWTRKEKSSDLNASITRIPIPQDPHPNGLLYTTKDIQIAILQINSMKSKIKEIQI